MSQPEKREAAGPRSERSVTFLSAPSGSPADVVRVDDVELRKGQPTEGLTDDQITRLQALPGLRFQIDQKER